MSNANVSEYFKALAKRIDGMTLYACATASIIGAILIMTGAVNVANEARRVVILLFSPVILLFSQIRLNQLPGGSSKTREALISIAITAEAIALSLI